MRVLRLAPSQASAGKKVGHEHPQFEVGHDSSQLSGTSCDFIARKIDYVLLTNRDHVLQSQCPPSLDIITMRLSLYDMEAYLPPSQ